MKTILMHWMLNQAILMDEWINMETFGDPGETVSSRAGKGMLRGVRWCCVLCRFLDWFEKDHCLKSIDPTEGRRAIDPD